jgi:hypothetical protein
MHRVQNRQLFFPQEQKDLEGKIGNDEVLRYLQEAHSAQRNEIGI